MSNPQTRQELYDEIKKSSKQEFILKEMRRLGYWKDDADQSIPDELLREKRELSQELSELVAKVKVYESREEALKEIHRRRMETARKNRAEKKEAREEERKRKEAAWKEKKEREN